MIFVRVKNDFAILKHVCNFILLNLIFYIFKIYNKLLKTYFKNILKIIKVNLIISKITFKHTYLFLIY